VDGLAHLLHGAIIAKSGEKAVAFAKAGNAIPNGIATAVNAAEQAIKMRPIAFTLAAGLNHPFSKKACCASFSRVLRLKMYDEEA
jgi:hypothetical protein